MSKLLKRLLVEDLTQRFQEEDNVLALAYQGIDAEESRELRRGLRKSGMNLLVVKNSAARRAFKEVGMDGLIPYLEGPTAVLWGGEDLVGLARTAMEYASKYAPLEVKGGVAEGAGLSIEEVTALARYPSGKALLATLVADFDAPARSIIHIFSAAATQMVGLVEAIIEKNK